MSGGTTLKSTEGGPAMLPADEQKRIRSLAAMARALGRSAPLFRLLEIAAEEARTTMGASSVSVSRLERGSLTVRRIITVGDLGPAEQRWPEDETYALDHFANLSLVVEDLQIWSAALDDPACDPSERRLLIELGKGSSGGAPVVVAGRLWGELSAPGSVGEPQFGEDDIAYLEALV